ncbi:type II secretion system major pseudopilin GspG [Marinomonas sp. THO17]|uniref:type II secretion system major pseudopilin GspG n=1 Tax=Marinomonas sp. THO17 TaxID=3149048 RepID=UPI00336C1B61
MNYPILRLHNLKHKQSGFTLLEMLIVLVILASLIGFIAPNLLSRSDDAKITVTKVQMRHIVTALDVYKLDNNSYPSTAQGLEALISKPSGYPEAKNWKEGGYLPKFPLDAWGKAFLYVSPGATSDYDLMSLGADGVEGGSGDDADLSQNDL